jgi:NADH-quinone oxidoreductase subunit L
MSYDIHLDPTIAITSVVVAITSIALATYIYKGEKQPVAEKMRAAMPRLHRWAYKRFYMDEVYQFVTHRVIFAHISKPIAWFDRHIVDGFFDFLAWGANALGFQIRGLQNGSVQRYAFTFLVGILIVVLLLIL